MAALLMVTLIWAFSFPLIGHHLRGVDPFFVATLRLGLAMLCLLPWLRLQRTSGKARLELLGIGALQFGVMYSAYLSSFRFLASHLVPLFSVLTPLWVSLVAAGLQRESWRRGIPAALLAVTGALLVRGFKAPEGSFLLGFVLMQVSNLAFGGGQVWFREWKRRHPEVREREVFALPLCGGFLFSLLMWLLLGDPAFSRGLPSPTAWALMAYLGIVASGLGFFLWNYGASRVETAVLAAANNLVVPTAIGVTFLLFGERPASPLFFFLGSLLIVSGLLMGGRSYAQAPVGEASISE